MYIHKDMISQQVIFAYFQLIRHNIYSKYVTMEVKPNTSKHTADISLYEADIIFYVQNKRSNS